MRKFVVFLASAIISAASFAGVIDITARINDNTKQISKSLAKSIDYSGNDMHFVAVNVTAEGLTNTIQAGIGDAGLAYILNNGTNDVDVGIGSDTYVLQIKSGEFAVLPLATNTASIILDSRGGTQNVEIYVTER